MAADVQIKFDKRKLRQIERQLKGIPGAMPTVMSRGINRTAGPALTQIIREMAASLNLKSKAIREKVDLKKATRSRWTATIKLSGRRIALKEFGARQTRRGVSYKIQKSGAKQQIESAFIATMSSGHTGVFKRKGKSRLPVQELRGPSLGRAFEGAESLVRRVTEDTRKNLAMQIDKQVKYILEKRRSG